MSCIIKRLLTIKEPLQYGPVVIKDEFGNDITNTCMFSWSVDSVCWTDWVDVNQYNTICKNIETDFYLRVLLFGGFGKIIINSIDISCYSICLYDENMFLQDLCSDTLFDPYAGLDCALQLQQQMSDSVICMLGIPCYYFYVKSDADTAEYTFKEYVLHNVENVKYMKLMIQDGQMPSSKPQMTEMDFDWDVDWEVEVSKNYFAKAFGDNAFPKHNDFIYIPMMKRMWSVNSAYDEKNESLMWHSTTWKLALVKYNDNTNVIKGDFEDAIDSLLNNTFDNMFKYKERDEQEDDTGITQVTSPEFASNNTSQIFMTDYLRKSVPTSEIRNVGVEQVNHKSLVLARNCYDFKGEKSAIEYQNRYCGNSGTMIMLIDYKYVPALEKVLFKAGDIVVSISDRYIKFNGVGYRLESNKYIIVVDWDKQTYTSSFKIYPQVKPTNTPEYMIKPEFCSFDFEHPESQTMQFNEDFEIFEPTQITLSPYPYKVYYLKLFDRKLNNQDAIKEACKYTTKNEHCVINDIARPFEEAYGYTVR